jgi:hypothetical protein
MKKALKKKKLILIMLIAYLIMPNDNTFCGNTGPDTQAQELQELVREYLDEMDEVEIDQFGREVLRLHGPRQIHVPQGWPVEANTEQENQSVWTPIVMYVLFSTTIILVSLYHREIIDFIFNVTQDIFTEILPTAINGLIPREMVSRLTLQMIQQNPESREAILMLLRRIREARQLTRSA